MKFLPIEFSLLGQSLTNVGMKLFLIWSIILLNIIIRYIKLNFNIFYIFFNVYIFLALIHIYNFII